MRKLLFECLEDRMLLSRGSLGALFGQLGRGSQLGSRSEVIQAMSRDDAVVTATAPAEVAVVQSSVLPQIWIVASDTTASEQGRDPGSITLARSGSTASSLGVNIQYLGVGTNPAGQGDWTTTTAVFYQGQSSITVIVTPVDDQVVEQNEQLRLTLQPAYGAYTLTADISRTITIQDNEWRWIRPQGPGYNSTWYSFSASDQVNSMWGGPYGWLYANGWADSSYWDAVAADLSGNLQEYWHTHSTGTGLFFGFGLNEQTGDIYLNDWEPPYLASDGELQVAMGYTIEIDDDNIDMNTVTVGLRFVVIAAGQLNVEPIPGGMGVTWPITSTDVIPKSATTVLRAHKGPQ